MPTAPTADVTIAAARDLIQALPHPASAAPNSPISLTDSQHAALQQLATIFSNVSTPTPPSTAPPPGPEPLLQPAPLPMPAPPAALPRVCFSPETNPPSPLPRVVPRSTTTYISCTGKPGRRRRQQQTSSTNSSHVLRSANHCCTSCRNGSTPINAHTAHQALSALHSSPPPSLQSTTDPVISARPAHAYWTANASQCGGMLRSS